MSTKDRVRVFEVGPRDGLQNEPAIVKTQAKLEWVKDLLAAGVDDFELGAFVRPDKVPQMADTDALYREWAKKKAWMKGSTPWALVPNVRGLERAIATGVRNVAVFTAASETFNRKNIGMSVAESLKVIGEVAKLAAENKIRVRGYVSTVFGCPFEGKVSPLKALRVIERLGELGVEQVSMGDTIGVATPGGVEEVIRGALFLLGGDATAVHFHDTRGTALANTLRAIDLGVRTVDSSAGGLGGCPFAQGATGNLATEDLVYMLDGMGMKTGIDLKKLARADLKFMKKMKRPLSSRYLIAFEKSGK